MNETFNKNLRVEKFTNMLGIAVRLIVIDSLTLIVRLFELFLVVVKFKLLTYMSKRI